MPPREPGFVLETHRGHGQYSPPRMAPTGARHSSSLSQGSTTHLTVLNIHQDWSDFFNYQHLINQQSVNYIFRLNISITVDKPLY